MNDIEIIGICFGVSFFSYVMFRFVYVKQMVNALKHLRVDIVMVPTLDDIVPGNQPYRFCLLAHISLGAMFGLMGPLAYIIFSCVISWQVADACRRKNEAMSERRGIRRCSSGN